MKIDDLNLPPAATAKIAHLLVKLKDVQLPRPGGYYILAVQWVRGEKIAGTSLFAAEVTKREDKYQGRSGLVIAIGPDAYRGDRYPSGPWCRVGDWIAWPAMENAAARMEYAGVVITTIPDDRVVLIGVDPEIVS
jgi:hypothetical protein